MSRRIPTGMNGMSHLQLMAAAVAMGASVLSAATGQPLRNAAEPHRRRYQPPRNTEQQREIAEHNAAIDAKRAEKKALKAMNGNTQ